MYLFCVFVFWLQKCRFERLEVHQTCIYSKQQHFDAKSTQHLHILKKIKSFDSEKSPNLHILKKIKSFDSEKSPNLHILKKPNILIGKSYKTCIYSKKSKKHKPSHLCQWLPHRVWDFCFFLIFLSICRLGDFSLSKLLIFLSICRFGDCSLSKLLTFLSICRCCVLLASECWFFWVYAGYVTLSKIMHVLLFMQVLERYKSQNLQRVCNFEVNKAQMKNGIRFCFSFYFILLKNNDHQNKTNRMCIKHWNLQCFLSMSLNAFNTTLGKLHIPLLPR